MILESHKSWMLIKFSKGIKAENHFKFCFPTNEKSSINKKLFVFFVVFKNYETVIIFIKKNSDKFFGINQYGDFCDASCTIDLLPLAASYEIKTLIWLL